MGRFSSHLKVVADQTAPCSFTALPYAFVNYSRLTTLSNEGSDAHTFTAAWDEELAAITSNFDEHYMTATKIMIDSIFEHEEFTYNHPALLSPDPRQHIETLLKSKGRDFVLDLLKDFKILLQTADLNTEALHLALVKYDKRSARRADGEGNKLKKGLLIELLPKLYASSPYHATGSRTLVEEINIVRDLLDSEDEAGDVSPKKGRSTISENADVLRGEEWKWFLSSVKEHLSEKDTACLVAHRGFHCEKDDSVTRPIENSLASFEYAWAAGIKYAECDVGITKDEKIIMAHDSDFKRLALLSDVTEANTIVKDLTLSDIMKMPLKHGSRPPLLVDVLRSALAIGEHAKLVIEIKPGNSEIVEPLMMLFERHPNLLSCVGVIMSFDAYVMQEIADKFAIDSIGGGLDVIAEGEYSEDKSNALSRSTTARGRRTMARSMQRSVSLRSSVGRHFMQSVSYNFDSSSASVEKPKLLVLTRWYESKGRANIITSVKDGFTARHQTDVSSGEPMMLTDKVGPYSGLSGVYLEYEPEMLEPEGRKKMLELADIYDCVGVWMLKPRDPDALSVCKRLVEECNVSFVNTDFHREFFTT